MHLVLDKPDRAAFQRRGRARSPCRRQLLDEGASRMPLVLGVG